MVFPATAETSDPSKQTVPDPEYEKALFTGLYITIVLAVIAVLAYSAEYEKEDSIDLDLPLVPEKDSVLLNMDEDLRDKFKPTLDTYRKLVSKSEKGNEPLKSEPVKGEPIKVKCEPIESGLEIKVKHEPMKNDLERDSGPE